MNKMVEPLLHNLWMFFLSKLFPSVFPRRVKMDQAEANSIETVVENILDVVISAIPGNPALLVPEEKEAMHFILTGVVKFLVTKQPVVVAEVKTS